MEWISVEDRSPKQHIGNFVICSDICGNVFAAIVSKRLTFLEEPGGLAFNHVTHWMPLPEPPTVSN